MPVPSDEPMARDRSTALKRFLSRHPVLAFIFMGISFLLVGLISLNMIYMFHANIEFIIDHGVMALRDGGLHQLLELVVTGYVGMALFVLFKACEKTVVERMLEKKAVQPKAPPARP